MNITAPGPASSSKDAIADARDSFAQAAAAVLRAAQASRNASEKNAKRPTTTSATGR